MRLYWYHISHPLHCRNAHRCTSLSLPVGTAGGAGWYEVHTPGCPKVTQSESDHSLLMSPGVPASSFHFHLSAQPVMVSKMLIFHSYQLLKL